MELGCIPLREIIRKRRLGFLQYILNENSESLVNRFFKSQSKNKTRRDWVSTVEKDLNLLGLSAFTMDKIKNMKKSSFMNMVKRRIEKYSFEKLQQKKMTHSKVDKLEHSEIKIQKYLQPNQSEISRTEAQLIFKLRCRVTNLKTNLKGNYETLECEACGGDDETQEHILACKVINENRTIEQVNYDKLLKGTVKEKLKVAKLFEENFKILEDIKKSK